MAFSLNNSDSHNRDIAPDGGADEATRSRRRRILATSEQKAADRQRKRRQSRAKRRQFPIRPAFVMSVNKAQGQTLACAGVLLDEPVCDGENALDETHTTNVVYKEVLTHS